MHANVRDARNGFIFYHPRTRATGRDNDSVSFRDDCIMITIYNDITAVIVRGKNGKRRVLPKATWRKGSRAKMMRQKTLGTKGL